MAAGRKRNRWWTVIAAAAIIAGACGGDADDTAEGTEQTSTTRSEPTGETAEATTRRAVTHGAFNGLRLSLPPDAHAHTEGDYVGVWVPGDGARVVIARAAAGLSGAAIESVDDLVAEVQTGAAATVEVGDETIDLFDQTLTLHRFDGTPPGGPGLIPSQPLGATANVWWSPVPVGELFLGDVDGGVLVAGVVAESTEAIAAGRVLLDDVLAGAELIAGELTAARIGLVDVSEEAAPFEPAPPSPGGEPPLPGPFEPAPPGTYQLTNLERTVVAEVGDDWFVAPNFPRITVFTVIPSLGPNYRDVVFFEDARSITPIAAGGEPLGPSVGLDDLDAVLADPPPGLLVSDVDRDATLGGQPAVRFDLRIDPAATCDADAACAFVVLGAEANFAKFVTAGAIHRTWIVDGENGVLLVSAATAEADVDWFASRVQPLLDGVTIS